MKNNLCGVLALAVLSTLGSQIPSLFAQGTAFTYQGRFAENGVATNGTVEFQFTLWNALSGGAQVASTTPPGTLVNVTNGLFTVLIDFGLTPFDGPDRYLQIEARTTLGPFVTLTPRQRITATPYALLAGKLSGPLASGSLTGTYGSALTFSNAANVFIGNGAGLTALNAAELSGAIPISALSNAWKVGGNAGTTAGVNFLGTTDNQPLELKVNGQRAFRVEPVFTITNTGPGYSIIYSNTANLIGGAAVNGADAGVLGAFIGGGGLDGAYLDQGAGYVFSGSFPNRVSAHFATIAGGYANVIQTDAFNSAIGGGGGNTIQTNATAATIGGGSANNIQTSASASTIGGGSGNRIQTSASDSTIGGGAGNNIETNAYRSVIAGGGPNTIRSNATYCTISGGEFNIIGSKARWSTIGGGDFNRIGFDAERATVPGGYQNSALADYSFAAGRQAHAEHDGTFVWSDNSSGFGFSSTASNQFLIRASGGVGINKNNPATALDVNGSASLSGSLNFGSTTRQMVNLWSTTFGIGVQNAVQYSRTSGGFAWFLNGSHDNATYAAGAGGTTLMTLDNAGLTVKGTFVSSSDRDAKERFEPLNPREMLDKVVALPLSKWSYKQDRTTRHLGPMAQDFYAAFGVGRDDKHIATVDADGVALGAIQGLNQKLEQQLEQKTAEIEELKQRLERLERLIDEKTAGAE